MKKPKRVKPFSFKDMSHQQMVDLVNNENPIKLKYNEDLINRVYARYPLIDKSQISIIVKAIFQSFRDLLVLGKVLNFNNLFFDAKIYFFDYRKDGHILPSLKVKISTPPPLRYYDK
jgi:hypothetical protein